MQQLIQRQKSTAVRFSVRESREIKKALEQLAVKYEVKPDEIITYPNARKGLKIPFFQMKPDKKDQQLLDLLNKHMNESNKESLEEVIKAILDEAEYQGRKVTVNKPTAVRKGEPGYGKKQEKVYVKDGPDEDDVKVVRFGDPNSKIRKSNPKARKSFRARHNCDSPGPKTKARYWSCKAW